MVNKVEFFKAVDKIDGAPSFFAIHSIDGEDVAYDVINQKGIQNLVTWWVILWQTGNVHGPIRHESRAAATCKIQSCFTRW